MNNLKDIITSYLKPSYSNPSPQEKFKEKHQLSIEPPPSKKKHQIKPPKPTDDSLQTRNLQTQQAFKLFVKKELEEAAQKKHKQPKRNPEYFTFK